MSECTLAPIGYTLTASASYRGAHDGKAIAGSVRVCFRAETLGSSGDTDSRRTEFWTNRLAATDPPLEISQTRIPEIPDQTEFLKRWFEFHQGYRTAKLPDGTEQRMPVLGEPLMEVSPGFLPRTLDQLREGVVNDALRPENRLRRRRLTSEEQRPVEPQQSLDSALDSLLAEMSDDETPRASQVSVPQLSETLQAARPSQGTPQIAGSTQSENPPQPMNVGEASPNSARARFARERFARVFGTAEDIQQDDYESPLSSMYNRAYDRYNQAEERRATDTTAPPPLDGLSAQERRDIEEQLLWGVMRESANDRGPEGNIWSYTPRSSQPSAPPRPIIMGRQEVPPHSSLHRFVDTAENADRLAAITRLMQQATNRIPIRIPPSATGRHHPTSGIPTTTGPSQSATSTISAPVPPAAAGATPASMAGLLRDQARYEALLADRMAEFERLRPDTQSTNPHPLEQPNDQAETSAGPSQSTTQSPSPDGNGMSQIQTSIQQITAELHRLRLASEAITSARHSMHTRFQHQPERPPQTLDNQPGRPSAMSDEDMTKKLECQVCYQQLANIALLPCGHMVMCQWCADVVIPVKHSHLPIRPSKCPMCRKAVKQRFKIHMG
jgi:hypothetical protein